MTPIHILTAFVILFGTFFEAQSCEPGPVRNLTITTRSVLNWVVPEGNCAVSNYLVTIRKDGDPNLVYYVATTTLNVSTLVTCERYEFLVTAIASDHTQGLETVLSTKTPPVGLDLTVGVFNATQTNQELLLTWSMKVGVEHCIDSFRIVTWDEDTVIPNDTYVQNTSLLISNVVPCMKYEFEIRAIIGAEEEGDPVFLNYTATAVPSTPPSLASINQGVTNVNITWNLQSYSINRCNISELRVDASPYFNASYPVVDSPARPPYVMTLNDLQPNTIYLCRISIINSAGSSSALAIAVQTQPNSTRAAIHRQKVLHHHLPSVPTSVSKRNLKLNLN